MNASTELKPAAGWEIREARPEDWPGIWAILEPVIRAGETFTWDRDTAEDEARARWFKQAPGQTFVAVGSGSSPGDRTRGGTGGADGDTGGAGGAGRATDAEAILGTGELHPNQGGGGSHVANAGYMVHPAQVGRGLARALCAYSLDAAREAGFRAMQFNAVVESNARAVAAWKSMGFEVLATIPEAFNHPTLGYVGLHVMYRKL
ncbi:GNAT family N-acetyltransferase [Arthrobacter oryzae]|uniref:GNAT family N-acetyltransferase n=1 Tax=Arthrobacter oryzae TaxID=409290 RepID=UPI000EADEF93|nr:GNAT family N-acetyltransferase [Arthrobacter oryzae]